MPVKKPARAKRPRATATCIATYDLSLDKTSREVLKRLFKDWATMMRACFKHKQARSKNYFYKVPDVVEAALETGLSDGVIMTVFGNATFHIYQCFELGNFKFLGMLRWKDYVVKLFKPHWTMRDNNVVLLDIYRPDKGRPQFAMQIKGYDKELDLGNKANFIGISHDIGADEYYVKFYSHPDVAPPEAPPPLIYPIEPVIKDGASCSGDFSELEPSEVNDSSESLLEPESVENSVKANVKALKGGRKRVNSKKIS